MVILIVALIIVGPKRLPELGRALGESIRAFQGSLNTPEHRDDSQ